MERGRPLARGRASAGAAWKPGIPRLVLWLVEEARDSRFEAQGSRLRADLPQKDQISKTRMRARCCL
jgi:hypothetical protein